MAGLASISQVPWGDSTLLAPLQRPAKSPDCLLSDVTHPSESQLTETRQKYNSAGIYTCTMCTSSVFLTIIA